MGRSNSKTSSGSKKSQSGSVASSPDITSRGPINNNMNNNNNNGPLLPATMSETSDDSSLNSVELDPIGKYAHIKRKHPTSNAHSHLHARVNEWKNDENAKIPCISFLTVFENLDTGAAYIDSDTGLESMSSAEATTKACSLCTDGGGIASDHGAAGLAGSSDGSGVHLESGHQIDSLRQEVTRLKCDKLDLLRQNVVSKLIHSV